MTYHQSTASKIISSSLFLQHSMDTVVFSLLETASFFTSVSPLVSVVIPVEVVQLH